MKVGVPIEENVYENRVSLSPYAIQILKRQGHLVFVASNAGEKSGYTNVQYQKAGAKILDSNEEIYAISDLIVKVNPPEKDEIKYIKENHVITCFLNLINHPEKAKELAKTNATFIGYESIKKGNGCPVVQSMSRIAGKLAFSIGTEILSKVNKGKGVLIGGSPSASRSKVVIIGAGTAGMEILKMANSMGSRVSVFDNDMDKLNKISEDYPSVETFYPYHELLVKQLSSADLVVGSVMSYKKKSAKLVSKEMLGGMEAYSVLIDLSISSGGVFETSKETNLGNPMYMVNNIYHYCVPNIPSCVPKTAANALSTSILPYILQITEKLLDSSYQLKEAIQIENGKVADFIPINSNKNNSEEKMNSLIRMLNKKDDD